MTQRKIAEVDRAPARTEKDDIGTAVLLKEIEKLFAIHPEVNRICCTRDRDRKLKITAMDSTPNPGDLRKKALSSGYRHELNRKRGWEVINGYHIVADEFVYRFYRL
jgi:hypothetical protein